MMNLKLIVVGKLKEVYWKEAEAEYLKRLKQYAKLTIVEISEEKFADQHNAEKIKQTEAEKILKHIPETGLTIALDARGKSFTSEAFADFLKNESTQGQQLTFIIGGPLGLHDTVLQKAAVQLSFSAFTFTHQMIRIFLLEQVYRANTIIRGKTYHY